MAFFENLKEGIRAQLRNFVLGQAVVDVSTASFGVDPTVFAPEEYGNYIATSNSVYTCATGRADLLVTLKPKLYRLKNGDRSEVEKGDLITLLRKVNPHWTFNRLMRMTELSMCLWGECFWFLERGQSGKQKPREIWWGKPSRVTVFPDPERYVRGFEYRYGAARLWYEPSEVIWFRFPNPIDEFSGLSPLAAARLAADYSNDAVHSNRNLFKNGSQMGGIMMPKGRVLEKEQALEIENQIDRRTRGVDKAHRWSVFRLEMEAKEMGVNPKDAEFLGGLKWSLEEICRAYKWPLDLVGGQRTYENYSAAMRAAYTFAVIPEADYLASEITEQLLPMFSGEADEMTLDSSEIEVLQEQETAAWTRSKEQIEAGAMTVNEWREGKGMKSLPWGDTWWAPMGKMAVEDLMEYGAPDEGDLGDVDEEPVEDEEAGEEEAGRLLRPGGLAMTRGGVEFGSVEHERAWKRFEARTVNWEKQVSRVVVSLFESQEESILAKLEGGREEESGRGVPRPYGEERALDEDLFNLREWIKKFRLKLRPVIREVVADVGEQVLRDDLGLSLAFDIKLPAVVRFIERRAQRFAEEVNKTTWEKLKKSLGEGLDDGEGIDKLSERVKDVMGERIRSTPEVIARTEVIGASNGGTLLAYRQSGVVKKKAWLAGLDERTRESHAAAHVKYQANPIGLDEDFRVGAGAGPAPGQIGLPEEDIQCRCTIVPVIEED